MKTSHESPAVELSIRAVEGAERAAALRRLSSGGLSATAQQADQLQTNAADLGVNVGLVWGGFRPSGGLAGAVLIVPQPGRTGMVFASRPGGPGRVEEMGRLIETACCAMPPRHVALAQSLLDPADESHAAAFRAAGFTRLATLCYLQARVPRRSLEPPTPAGVRLESWSPGRRSAFLAALDASYERTLDCPGMLGARRTEDALEGHMAAGEFDPALWTLLRVGDEPAGAMLLNPVPEAGCVELVYLGVAAAHRHRGLAGLLMRRGLWQCARHRQRRITLAVDEDNTPAMNLYRRFRFRRTARKLAMIRRLDLNR